MNARHAGPSPEADSGPEVDRHPEVDRAPDAGAGADPPAPADPRAQDDATAGGRHETRDERSDRNWNDILQELRVALTGTQLIGGFLLAVAFQPRFQELDGYQLTLYLVLIALAGLATVVGLAPVTLHRTLFRHQVKERVVRTGNRLLIAQLNVVALLVLGVTSFVFDFALSRLAGVIAFVIGAVVLVLLWVVLPRMEAEKDGGDGTGRAAPARDGQDGVGTPL